VRALGASNWTCERYESFNEAAGRRGATTFSMLSNQLSLAEMLEPVWKGCLRADSTWHERTQTPLLAWSAQARGFFAGREPDGELRRSWLSPQNLERRDRAERLAARLGVSPVAVALTWVLTRPFPTWAVVGPRSRRELNTCLEALQLEGEAAALRRLDAG
jgi:aryl-alcohol dehydrogenase-like predicted oxidoreductase